MYNCFWGFHGGKRNNRSVSHGEDNMKVLDAFSLGKFNSLFSPGEIYFELSADKICRATAQMLLQNAVKFNLAEFQEVWQQSVPEGMITRLEQLKVR